MVGTLWPAQEGRQVFSKNFLVSFKVFFALLALSSVITEIAVLVQRGIFNPANFFSYFTIESNIFALLVLVASAIAVAKGYQSAKFDLLRGAAALYMVTTGVVFAVLLSNLDADVLTAVPWDNTVLHYIMPVVMLLDWLFDPPKKRMVFKRALIWLVYPFAYVIYTLVRGAAVNWYPYPFLNPATNGYGGIFVTAVGITVTVVAVSGLLVHFVTLRTKLRK